MTRTRRANKNVILTRLLGIFLSLIVTPIFAVDGQIDILPSPTTGYTINSPGSYILVADVTITATDIDGITIDADDVTLDLNGHKITGPGSGTGAGIRRQITKGYRTHILNGKVSGFQFGILINEDSTLENITADSNQSYGIRAANNCRIIRCAASNNVGYGIYADGTSCYVENCVARFNNKTGYNGGIYVNDYGIVKNCLVAANNPLSGSDQKTTGISAGKGCKIINNHVTGHRTTASASPGSIYGIGSGSNCEIRNNSVVDNLCGTASGFCEGIYASDNCTIRENLCNQNKVSENQSSSIGIRCFERCLVINNQCNDNSSLAGTTGSGGFGIYTNMSNCTIIGNTCIGNNSSSVSCGIVSGIGARIEDNYCSNHTGALMENYGIKVGSEDCMVINNRTDDNSGKGIILTGTGNYVAENVSSDGIDAGTNTVGTGDRSNITY